MPIAGYAPQERHQLDLFNYNNRTQIVLQHPRAVSKQREVYKVIFLSLTINFFFKNFSFCIAYFCFFFLEHFLFYIRVEDPTLQPKKKNIPEGGGKVLLQQGVPNNTNKQKKPPRKPQVKRGEVCYRRNRFNSF